ncbi:methyl-accepting chemotaxis protein [Leisingera sp. ANG59]|uniref:methyl-accepting chemotaxis protein n=1 Tax=Leisingera sp. ANG59 TaxID=2675221 RepID=UPI001572E773|nr:methyl-accepting chemotaxis protein [Leisingera sp. ANG59]NSY37131.1 chemotaxis protein [Leisingera sp. ANG59]
MTSLTDVQNTAFLAIGPSRIAALSLLALAQVPEGADGASAEEVLALSVQRLTSAHDMLGSRLDAMLAECSYALPAELEAKRQSCLELLSPLHHAVTAADGAVLAHARAVPDLAALCLYRLEPAVSEFLEDMVETLREAQQQREEERDAQMRATIATAEGVGKNIKFISFNASIEAARIGEMGKGFAVIATEIRELSGRTQNLLEEMSGYLKH